MFCPNCDYSITEDDTVCKACSVKLWSKKILNTWNLLESQCKSVNPGATAKTSRAGIST